jgi:hypothetical protein
MTERQSKNFKKPAAHGHKVLIQFYIHSKNYSSCDTVPVNPPDYNARNEYTLYAERSTVCILNILTKTNSPAIFGYNTNLQHR